MPQSCRDAILNAWRDENKPIGTNGGLLRDRYLRVSVKDDKYEDARDELHEAIREAIVHSMDVYPLAHAKNFASIQIPKYDGIFITICRMIVGLGSENVLETGISLQHTYGTPLIPGSALKGLAAHYCHQVWGASDPKFKLGEEYHKTIFGTTEDSGHIIFHDAWLTPKSLADSLKPDVMTPHHSNYYSNKDGAAPTDFDDPKPIAFLSVVGSFHIAVSCDVQNEDGDKWAKLAFQMLTEALEEWGIGGKTNTGYGRLVLANSDDVGDRSLVKSNESSVTAAGSHGQRTQSQPRPAAKNLKYKKGDSVEVIKVPDPKEKRGEAYFMADDGIGGRVVLGTSPSIQIGEKTRLEINGVMEKEGLYNFAAIGAKRAPPRQTSGNRGRR